MPVVCQICNKEFASLISSSHLKTHNILTAEYKQKFGDTSLASDEYRSQRSGAVTGKNNPNFGNKLSILAKNSISKANTGKQAWNKGIPQTADIKQAISKANAGKQAWNKGIPQSDQTRAKIKYARKYQIILPESINKAINTKKSKGYDFAFFKGKSHTAESKQLISDGSKRAAQKKTETSLKAATERIAAAGYTIVSTTGKLATVNCNMGHTFEFTRQYLTNSKFKNTLCPICYPRDIVVSKAELELRAFVASLAVIEVNDRHIIAPYELDIVVPAKCIAFEFNGLYWHSDKHKESTYHKDKMQQCNNKGYKLIQIFEDEWLTSKEIVKSRISALLGQNKIIYARKCSVARISAITANKFIRKTHLQGVGRSNVAFGLFHSNTLVAVMTFLNSDISKNVIGWELNRFATELNVNIVGGASKLLAAFVNQINPEKITTFADLRWSNMSSFYTTIGFSFVHNSPPSYWYVYKNEIKRTHRYSLRKPTQSGISEKQLRESQGYSRIYDCGCAKYTMNLKNTKFV